jgi:hypothetical protein
VRADRLFTVPSGITHQLTGLWMVHFYRPPWDTTWIWIASIGWAHRVWMALGVPSFTAAMIVVWAMIAKSAAF